MSYTQRVLTAMNYGQQYSASDVAAITKLSETDAANCLHLLSKGG